MQTVAQVENLFVDNNWSILVDAQTEPLDGMVERYDISGFTFTSEFEIRCHYNDDKKVIVQEILAMDGKPFSNLRIQATDVVELVGHLVRQSKTISKATYSEFVSDLTQRCETLIFNDNGVWMTIGSKNQ